MPRYKIDQYEVCTLSYEVEEGNEAEAIKNVLDGKAQPLDGTFEFIGVCKELGLPVESNPDLAKSLQEVGVDVSKSIIPSIRSIELVEEQDDIDQSAETEEKQSLLNFYRCYRCGHEWQFRNILCKPVFNDCPECHVRNVSPYWYERCE